MAQRRVHIALVRDLLRKRQRFVQRRAVRGQNQGLHGRVQRICRGRRLFRGRRLIVQHGARFGQHQCKGVPALFGVARLLQRGGALNGFRQRLFVHQGEEFRVRPVRVVGAVAVAAVGHRQLERGCAGNIHKYMLHGGIPVHHAAVKLLHAVHIDRKGDGGDARIAHRAVHADVACEDEEILAGQIIGDLGVGVHAEAACIGRFLAVPAQKLERAAGGRLVLADGTPASAGALPGHVGGGHRGVADGDPDGLFRGCTLGIGDAVGRLIEARTVRPQIALHLDIPGEIAVLIVLRRDSLQQVAGGVRHGIRMVPHAGEHGLPVVGQQLGVRPIRMVGIVAVAAVRDDQPQLGGAGYVHVDKLGGGVLFHRAAGKPLFAVHIHLKGEGGRAGAAHCAVHANIAHKGVGVGPGQIVHDGGGRVDANALCKGALAAAGEQGDGLLGNALVLAHRAPSALRGFPVEVAQIGNGADHAHRDRNLGTVALGVLHRVGDAVIAAHAGVHRILGHDNGIADVHPFRAGGGHQGQGIERAVQGHGRVRIRLEARLAGVLPHRVARLGDVQFAVVRKRGVGV